MATPELLVPVHDTENTTKSVFDEDGEETIEKQTYINPSGSSQRYADPTQSISDDGVVWRYLTFDTELPPSTNALVFVYRRPDGSTMQPPCPDLEQFRSPFLWSEIRKTVTIWLACAATVLTAYAPGAYTSGIGQMTQEWHISPLVAELGVTVLTCGFGAAPMFLNPFSELNGRRPVFLMTGWLFVVFQVVCAITPTFGGMLVSRFFVGCFSSTFNAMVGGVVSDLYSVEDRNNAMALYSCAGLFGTGLGLLVSGYIAQHLSWRWIFYVQIILDGVLMITISLFFKETRGSVLLSCKAAALNRWYDQLESSGYLHIVNSTSSASSQAAVARSVQSGTEKTTLQRTRWKVRSDEERRSVLQMIKISLSRPVHMLFTEPVVFFFSLWIAFAWSVLYLTFSAIPLVYETTYHFNLEQTDSIFAALMVASVLSYLLSIGQDKLARRYSPSYRALQERPEGRLVFACVEAALLPIGCIWFGVTGAYASIPWVVPTLGIGCAVMGIFSIYLAVFLYLADTYYIYASSALAAQNLCRNLLGGAFPLFAPEMFRTMTFQGAGGFLGGCGFILLCIPWVLLMYGPKIRARSRLASQFVDEYRK